MSDHKELKKKVYDATMALNQAGLIRLSAGNVSARGEDGLIAITPARFPYDRMTADDIAVIDVNGNRIEGAHRPSSEVPMHTAVYRAMPDISAVVHTHSIYAITFSTVDRPLEILCVESLAAGGRVPIARYAPPGTVLAGEVLMEALRSTPGLRAVLLRNHGLVAIGPDITTTWQTAYKVELSAQIQYQASQLGTPVAMTEEQVKEIFSVYMKAK